MKILFADDHLGNREAMELLMEDTEYELDIVSNGKKAFEYAKRKKYDLCIMDIQMPVMDGYEATKRIRRELDFLPIMALTSVLEKEECFSVGIDDVMEKMYDISELYQKIVELTVKICKLQVVNNKLKVTKEAPMSSKHLEELRELDKKGLTKLVLKGRGYEFVVHKNVHNKISLDFIGEGKELSEFLDRSEDKPGVCHLYKSTQDVYIRCILPEELKERIEEEDRILEKCVYPVSKSKEETKK